MSITWPKLSNIDSRILNGSFNKPNDFSTTQRVCWVRVFSGAVRKLAAGVGKDGKKISVNSNGLILASSNDFGIFKAAGQTKGGTIYGDSQSTGDFGISWDGKLVQTPGEVALRPSPIVTGLEMKEGTDQISRECVLKLKCFTLKQMELVQTYFLEPGYSLCIEFGWNSNAGAAQMINTNVGSKKILSQITERNINYDKLYEYRTKSNGDYDTFLGFIVGGTVSSDGDKWNVEVKLRGAPALPTYMQTQNRTLAITSVENEGSYIETSTYSQDLLEQPSDTHDASNISGKRRFRTMFNDLPATKQTNEVKDLIDTVYGYDFINFDTIVTKIITQFVNPGKNETVTINDVNIEKEKLFSKNRYIRFELAVKILNSNSEFNAYKLGDKNISVKFDIADSKIGAFPHMYSTKALKLVIPNPAMPDFSVYFLTGDSIKQKADGTLNGFGGTTKLINESVEYTINFPEQTPISATIKNKDKNNISKEKDGFTESAYYWGYLKNLYINFDVFKEKIQQKNKNIREVFLDMLNEMSSAVNSFWNFQIHEKILKEDNPEFGLKKGDVILSVYDENWVGNKADEQPHKFYHSGPNSVFLDASLDISVPSEMTNQIISRRLSLINNPDEPIVGVGGFFESDTDLFLNNYLDSNGKDKLNTSKEDKEKAEFEKLVKRINDEEPQSSKLKRERTNYQSQRDDIINNGDEDGIDTKKDANGRPLNLKTADAEIERNKKDFKTVSRTNLQGITYYENVYGKDYNRAVANKNDLEKKLADINKRLDSLDNEIFQAKKSEETAKVETKKAAITGNLSKIDVVIDPKWIQFGASEVAKAATDLTELKKYFKIWCFDDTAYFDLLKNYAFEIHNGTKPKEAEKKVTPKGLSHPLPIKYSFKILGNSGIRRGDMFNIIGIPSKYSQNGLFQVTQIEHVLEGSMWTTQITGAYRQYQ